MRGPTQPEPGGSPLIAFYRGEGLDAGGRTLDEILAWTDARLESVHDFIQWLFPLAEPSAFNARAPRVTILEARMFAEDPALRANLERAFVRFLSFLGLGIERRGDRLEVANSPTFERRRSEWLYPGSHNLLRITRVLKSLRLLGFEEYAQALFRALERIYVEDPESVGAQSYAYWKDAVTQPKTRN